ncbi:hypothetical protein ACFL7M_16875 [Thermodesulfobacteriota bacterium]
MASLDDVYKKFGETAEAAQLLETEISNILLSIKAVEYDFFQNQNKSMAHGILEKINKSTLGTLLKKVEEIIGGEENLIKIFQNALNERNRLSHSFYREHNFRRNSNKGCDIMLEDLEKMHKTILQAYKVALALSGIDLDKLDLPIPTKHLQL